MEADKATYLTARSQMERNKRLLEKQAISRQDYEMADAAYVRAKSATRILKRPSRIPDCARRSQGPSKRST